jgi:xanthine dehydrogenase large subunit
VNKPGELSLLRPVLGTPLLHESALAQVRGLAPFVDDIPELKGTLHAAPILSTVAHGKLLGIDAAGAMAVPGVMDIVTASDIPGDPIFAAQVRDEPIFALDEVLYAGQVVGLVVATSLRVARAAAAKVRLRVEELPSILTIEDALKAESYVLPPVFMVRGEPDKAIANAEHKLSGELTIGGQEHFYLEGQAAYALPGEQGTWRVYSSNQHPGGAQEWVAHALGIDRAQVTVETRRIGGGFGGKETQANHLCVWSVLAACKTGRPVKMRLDRDDDMTLTGKRHPFQFKYTVGFDDRGLILGMKVHMASQCGFSADLSDAVNSRAICHIDNAYFLEHVAIASYRCKTHTQSSTAFRGFGGPQGMLCIEAAIEDIARRLGKDPLDVRRLNFYGVNERNITPYGQTIEDNILDPIVSRLEKSSDYRRRRAEIERRNKSSPVIKRGIALTPLKFGISFNATFLNQAGALVNVYTDGSVQVNHGGTEMGQGLNTKVCMVVADELGVPFPSVQITAANTDRVPNASATAASSSSDMNGRAAQMAARKIKERLVKYLAERDDCAPEAVVMAGGIVTTPRGNQTFAELVQAAWMTRIQLWSDGFYKTPKINWDGMNLTGRPFYYFVYGAACAEVAIDTLTGENRVIAVDILHDIGRSINPGIDIGQVEGGFIQGMGWLTSEELVWNAAGKLLSHAPSTYKIPATGDVPKHFKVELWSEANREDNVYGSKATGEPPLMLALSVFEAIRHAITCVARPEVMQIPLQAPATPESILRTVTAVQS